MSVPATITTRVLNGFDDPSFTQSDWERLLASGPSDVVFLTWHWQSAWWEPASPVPGDQITIFYDAVAGTLPDGATNVILHWGVNQSGPGNWQLPPQAMWPAGTVAQGQAARSPMVALGNGLFNVSFTTLDTIFSVHFVTTDGTNWDNSNNQNWDNYRQFV